MLFNILSYFNCFECFKKKSKSHEDCISIDKEWNDIINDISNYEFELIELNNSVNI